MDIVEVIKQPVFWILSGIVSVILSVTANLVTPFVAQRLSTSKQQRHQKKVAEKHALRNQVLIFMRDPNLRIGAKLDAIYWILRAVLLFALALLIMDMISALPIYDFAAILIFFIAALCMARSGQWITRGKARVKAAFLAEDREAAIAAFCREKKSDPNSPEASVFASEWDRKEFGLAPEDMNG